MKTETWQAGRITLSAQEILEMFINSKHAGEVIVGSDIQVGFNGDSVVLEWAGPVNLVDPGIAVKKPKSPYQLGLSAANADMARMESNGIHIIAENPFLENSAEFDEWERGYSASGIDL